MLVCIKFTHSFKNNVTWKKEALSFFLIEDFASVMVAVLGDYF